MASHNHVHPPTGPSSSDTLPPLDIETIQAHVQSVSNRLKRNSPIYNLLMSDTQITGVTRGTVTSRLTLSPVHVNSKGGLHGAVSAAIIDFTTGLAIASWDLRETTGASVDMHISYLSSVAGVGDVLEVVAAAERVGGAMAFVTVRIAKVEDEEGGRVLVSLGQHTKYVKRP